jgi:Fe-S cluster assembly scaffold protein SufB
MDIMDYTEEYKYLIDYIESLGDDKEPFQDPEYATAVLNNEKVLAIKSIKGIHLDYEKEGELIKFYIEVEDGVISKKPVHLCFGSLTGEFSQKLYNTFKIGKGAKVDFIVHCIFPDVPNMEHIMTGDFDLSEGAKVSYKETHYHGDKYGVYVDTKTIVKQEKESLYITEFKLVKGKVGELKLFVDANLSEKAIIEAYAKIYAKGNDKVKIEDNIYLNGARAKGLSKSRVVLIENSESEFIGKTYGRGAFARGHIDCAEIIKDNAKAKAVPIVEVEHPLAKITHEAAIGSIDRNQIEALMAKGLYENEAIDVIVRGLIS